MPRREDDDEDIKNASVVEGGHQAYSAILTFLNKVRKSPENEGEVNIILSQTTSRKDAKKSDEDSFANFPFDMHTDPDELANEIADEAVEHCEGLRARTMKYSVRAAGFTARCVFTLTGDDGEEEDIDDVDDLPNRKGLLGLLMRHTQGNHKLSIGAAKHMIDSLMQQVDKKDEIIERLQKQAMENVKAYEELVSGRHMRDMEVRRTENKDRRMDMLAGTVLQGFPLLIGKFLGGGAGASAMQEVPGARTPVEAMIEGFLRTMDPNQFQALLASGVLRPEQIAGLVELVKFIMERDEADKAKAAGAQNGAANGAPPPTQAAPQPEAGA